MNQYLSIRAVRTMLRQVIEMTESPEAVERMEAIDRELEAFHNTGVDFKEVVDNLDDSILIADAQGTVLYINPAYTRNTGITDADVLGKDIYTLIGTDKLFTGGAVPIVLST